MNFEILIPSYKRKHLIHQQTLNLLNKHAIPRNQIHIFLRDEEEKEDYNLDENYNVVLTNAKGIMDTRNFLQEWSLNNNFKNVLYMDDDIRDIYEYDKPLENLILFGNNFFNELKQNNLFFGGISACDNKYFLRPTTSTNLKYIIGCLRFEIIRRDVPLIKCTMGQFEDYEFSCKYFLRDGGVLRKNNYVCKTKYFNPKGGITEDMGGEEERNQKIDNNAKKLVNMFPKMCSIVQKKNRKNIRLNNYFKNIDKDV